MQHSVLFPTFKHAHQDKNKLISGNHRSNFERAPSGFGGKDYTDSSRPVKKTTKQKSMLIAEYSVLILISHPPSFSGGAFIKFVCVLKFQYRYLGLQVTSCLCTCSKG